MGFGIDYWLGASLIHLVFVLVTACAAIYQSVKAIESGTDSDFALAVLWILSFGFQGFFLLNAIHRYLNP